MPSTNRLFPELLIKTVAASACKPSEVLQPAFAQDIRDLLLKFGLNPESVHLVIDYETTNPMELNAQSVIVRIPSLNSWKTLTVASGAFPPDLQDFEPGNWRIPRKDWLAWTRTVQESDGRIRKPSFSDYTIQYGLYKEPPDFCNPSVSILYTLENDWFIMRGEATRGKYPRATEVRPGREQWNAQAQLLCESEELFYGPKFSRGDGFIYEQSKNTKKGSFEIWLRAGINHHMTVVSRQIANLDAA
jgi:Beta protein